MCCYQDEKHSIVVTAFAACVLVPLVAVGLPKDGRCIKGEGKTDADALNQVRNLLPPQPPAGQTKEPTI